MAKYKEPKEKTSEPKCVYCSECRRFKRDTEGINYRRDTGEYFMGKCEMGHHDGLVKVFADKPRVCGDWLTNI